MLYILCVSYKIFTVISAIVLDILKSVLAEAGYENLPPDEIPDILQPIKFTKKNVHSWIIYKSGDAFVGFEYKNLFYKTNLRGKFQAVNCAYCLEIIDRLCRRGFNITREHIDNAFINIPLNGRFETVSKKPLVIYDNAQSPEEIKNFASNIDDYYGRAMQKLLVSRHNLHPKPFRRLIIFSLLKTFDCYACLKELAKIKQNVTIIFTTGPDSESFWLPEILQKTYTEIYSGIVKTSVFTDGNVLQYAVKNFSDRKIFCVGAPLHML